VSRPVAFFSSDGVQAARRRDPVSLNPNRTKQAQIASLVRRARAAEARGRILETIELLREVAELDPDDRRTLHHLGDIFRLKLNRMSDAATWYARAARALERDDLPIRALASWRTVLQCNPLDVEAHERIGALYVDTGRLADARVHWARSERVLREAGLGRDAAIIRVQREAMDPAAAHQAASPSAQADDLPQDPLAETTRIPDLSWRARPAPRPDALPASLAEADSDAANLVAERVDSGRSFLQFGLHGDARRALEEALALAPDHVEARELLAQACRALGDTSAATYHLDMLVQVMRRHALAAGSPAEASPTGDLDPAAMTIVLPGVPRSAVASAAAAAAPASDPDLALDLDEPLLLPPFEEWGLATAQTRREGNDVFADLMDDVSGDVERLVDRVRDDEGHE
jgi:tetratricopeptide (TPR) repeat protein